MRRKKVLGIIACAVMAVALTTGVAGCSSGGAPSSTGTYLSENELSYSNFLPTYNYFFIVSTTQQLDTYDDNTYCLTITTSMYSNISVGADVAAGDETWNDRGQTITRYYGNCTVEVDESDSAISFVTISTPYRVVYASYGSQYYDTDNWTDAMTSASESDAATYLETMVGEFPDEGISILVNLTACTFSQVSW